MADMFNNNLNNNTFSNGSNNLRPSKPFGLNVKVPERTLQQIGNSVKNNTTSGVSNIFNYLAANEKVFDGSVTKELNNLFVQDFNTKQILKEADTKVGQHFEMDM